MVQNKKNYATRPATRPATHPANTAVKHVEKKEKCCGNACKCDETCKCGCQSDNNLCLSNIVNGIMTLIGCILIAGSILVLHRVDTQVPQTAKATQKEVAKFDEKAIAAWINANPKLIIDSVDAFYKKQQAGRPAAPKVADAAMIKEIMEDKTNTVMGNPKGSFVMIEFFDYNCGYCKMMNKKMAEAIKKSDNIRWILIDTPIFGDKSEVISRYALAAGKQGKFAEFHAALETAQDKTEAGLKEIGKKVGLDIAKLEKDANSDAVRSKIEKNKEYSKKLQMAGVPVFIIDGNVQAGAFTDDKMEEYIQKANEMKQ